MILTKYKGVAFMEIFAVATLFGIIAIIIGIAVLFALVNYIISACALHKISKKVGRTYGWLAWIPVASAILQGFVLYDLAADKPFSLFGGKIKFKNRLTSFIIFAIASLVSGIISGVSTTISTPSDLNEETVVLSIAVLVIACISAVISFIISFVLGCINYVYLRDTIELFNSDNASCKKTAVIVTLLSYLICPLVQPIYLLVLSKKDLISASSIPYAETTI